MAADRKLNSVNLVNNASYVYAETSSGETVKISKADLATVLADGISNGGHEVLYQSSNPKDFNGCTLTGVYAFGGVSVSNGPVSNAYGTLIVFNSKFTGGYSVQLFFSKAGSFYFRFGEGDWVTVK